MSNKIITIFSLFVLWANNVSSQDIVATYRVTIKPISECTDTILKPIRYYSKIEANFNARRTLHDSIQVYAKCFVKELGANIDSVYCYYKNNTQFKLDSNMYSYQNSMLTIRNLTKNIKSISVYYAYIGSSFLRTNDFNKIRIFGGENFESYTDMFFYPIGVKCKSKIEVNIEKNKNVFFSENHTKLNKGMYDTYYINSLKNTVLSNFIILIMEDKMFNKISVIVKKDTMDIYTPNSKTNTNATKLNIEKFYSTYNHKTNLAKNQKVDLIGFDWNKNGFAFGRVFNNLALIDTSFFRNHSLLHELMHTYFKIPVAIDSKGYYILNESLIEYLAAYITYFPTSAYYTYLNRIKSDTLIDGSKTNISILEIDQNINETRNLIYYKTPYIWGYIASKVGEKKFAKIAGDFFLDNASNPNANYDTFCKYIMKRGISKDIVLEFDSIMRSRNITDIINSLNIKH